MEYYDNNQEKDQFSPNPNIDIDDYIDEEATYLEELKHKQDDFLDIYSVYLKVHTEFTKNVLRRKAIELEVIDPTFEFDID